MKIGLFGDSFGYQKSDQPFDSWVDLLGKHFEIVNHCECGISQYKILNQLKSTSLSQFDCLLITHTSATRTFVRYNPLHANSQYHKNCDIIYADIAERNDNFSSACQQYFQHIFDLDYAIDLHNLICKEIHNMCLNKKIIHMTHFDYTRLYQFPNLLNFYQIWLKNQGPVNHYNQVGNQLVYQTVLNELT